MPTTAFQQKSDVRLQEPAHARGNGLNRKEPPPAPLNMKITVDEYGGQYFVEGSLGESSSVLGTCQGGVGYVNTFFAPHDTNAAGEKLLLAEFMAMLLRLGSKKLHIHVNSPEALKELMEVLGEDRLAEHYKAAAHALSRHGSGNIDISV